MCITTCFGLLPLPSKHLHVSSHTEIEPGILPGDLAAYSPGVLYLQLMVIVRELFAMT
jgi:hypothetical protein